MTAEKIPAISVIIPMYNTEKYIGECLQSLLNQTLKNFEVIVVDDCSSDNSFEVAQKMIPAFENIGVVLTVIKLEKNSGCPGVPRNVAMDLARGKYIYFLDSDDFLDEITLEYLYKIAEEFDTDVVHAERCFEYREVDGKFENIAIGIESTAATKKPTLINSDVESRMAELVAKRYTTMIWNNLYRRDFLVANGIKFPAIEATEDMIFSAMYLSCARNYVRVPFIQYHYRKHAASVTANPTTADKYSLILIEGLNFFDKFLRERKFFIENPNCRYLLINLFAQSCAETISKSIFFGMGEEPATVYDFYRKNIFKRNPQKNIPLTAYLFTSLNVYKVLAKQQTEELARLKSLAESK